IFFFQAEDGIRDGHVTGVQTCALPISPSRSLRHGFVQSPLEPVKSDSLLFEPEERRWCKRAGDDLRMPRLAWATDIHLEFCSAEIGRASCRERVEGWGGDGGVKSGRRR